MDYNFDDICIALKKGNIKEGDNVLCHSNLGFFGMPLRVKNANSLCKLFYKAIKKTIEKNGTLIVPAFSYSFLKKKNFNLNCKSDTGIFSEYVRNLPNSLRSLDPNFSVVAIGKNKIFFTELPTNNTYGEGSFFDKFHKLDGKIVDFNFLGSTIIHYYERKLGVPYRFDKNFKGKVHNKYVTWTVFSRYLKREYVHDPLPITKILRTKKYFYRSRLGKGEMTSISSKRFFKLIKSELKKDLYLLTEKHKYKK